jgi:hypothetical protein
MRQQHKHYLRNKRNINSHLSHSHLHTKEHTIKHSINNKRLLIYMRHQLNLIILNLKGLMSMEVHTHTAPHLPLSLQVIPAHMVLKQILDPLLKTLV